MLRNSGFRPKKNEVEEFILLKIKYLYFHKKTEDNMNSWLVLTL